MITPPSPVVTDLTGWNEKTVMSEYLQLPTLLPQSYEAPRACAASSIMATLLDFKFSDKLKDILKDFKTKLEDAKLPLPSGL